MNLGSVPWRATRHPGVSIHFYSSDEGSHRVLALIRMDQGCGYPAHRHRGPEDVLVIRGGYADAQGQHRAGTFVHYEEGSEHAPEALRSADGSPCVLLALAHEGVTLLG